jgi:hypothetical protein
LNKLINCAVALEPEQRDFFPFLHCMEGLVLHDVSAAKVSRRSHDWLEVQLLSGSAGYAIYANPC